MARGGKREGAGRKKGSVDQSTVKAREAIHKFTEEYSDKLAEWLDQIAKESPKQAFDCYISVLEYNLPKLSRTDANVSHGGELQLNAKVTYVDSKHTDTE